MLQYDSLRITCDKSMSTRTSKSASAWSYERTCACSILCPSSNNHPPASPTQTSRNNILIRKLDKKLCITVDGVSGDSLMEIE
mmetsp:Transcript_19244/g.41713  ORF Transcript_19244/g.41713 Transcript_19244/m.41713 type:complete len:83 (-) Transcript_19244:192-440(-)